MEFTQMFPNDVNVFNFKQIWMKFFSFAQIKLKLLSHI